MSVCLSLICTVWMSAAELPAADISPALDQWLRDSGSMTQRLRDYSKDVYVKVLQHRWQVIDQESAEYLNITPQSQAIIREVIIYGEDKPLIYAVSVFPKLIVEATGGQLIDQGSKPLGEILFSSPDVKRSEFQFSELDAEQTKSICEKTGVTLADHHLWARRSTFDLQGKQLSVLEVFLPALIEKIQ